MSTLAGKTISILGASTSTFDGYSNSASYNTTLPLNAPYYPKPEFMNDARDTWWMRTIDALPLKLCVNNSWSGSCVTTVTDGEEKAGCMLRATQLHNDREQTEPDIIILITGGNDALRGYEAGTYTGVSGIYDSARRAYIGDCTVFANAYATMVHKVKMRYPQADVYVCSMMHWVVTKHDCGVDQYNTVVRQIADDFGVTYIDFYNQSGIQPDTVGTYLHTDGIHPNPLGFAQMADCVTKAIKGRYGE